MAFAGFLRCQGQAPMFPFYNNACVPDPWDPGFLFFRICVCFGLI